MDEKPTADISELVQLMFVGLMGANNEINKVLKAFHEEHDKPSHGFLFYEFLVHQPLYKEPYTDSFNKTLIFSPFPHRLARKSLAMTDEKLAEADILINMDDDQFTKRMYKYWGKNEKDKNIENILQLKFEPLEAPFIDFKVFNNPFFTIIQNYSAQNMDKLYDTLRSNGVQKYSNESFKTLTNLREPLIGLKKEKLITSFLIPIASSQVFYGDLFVCVPHFHNNEDSIKLKQLASELLKCVKRHYVPALALIHEHFFENWISKQKDIGIQELMGQYDVWVQNEKIEKSYYSPICRRATNSDASERVKCCYECEYFGWEESSDNIVEKYLHKLWQDRKTIKDEKYINASLFFNNRLRTDPVMLDVLESFLKPSKSKLKKDDDLLPSILVVASPGAGKEDVPKLIKLFSDCYNRGKTYKLNMASLKPHAIAPIAMVGGETTWQESIYKEGKHEEIGMPKDVRLLGILQEIRGKTRNEFEIFVKDEEDGLDKKIKGYIKNTEEKKLKR